MSAEAAVALTTVSISTDDALLPGDLVVPAGALGIVVFAHGSGSSRHSPRNRMVAATLNGAGIGTLLVDLLERVARHAVDWFVRHLAGPHETERRQVETPEGVDGPR